MKSRWIVSDSTDRPKAENTGMKATRKTNTAIQTRPSEAPPVSKPLPAYRVLLHNDDHNEGTFVVRALVELTPLSSPLAREVMVAAQSRGVALVLVTHKERAELYQEQFGSRSLTVTIEPE